MVSGGAELGAVQVAEALVDAGHRSLIVSEGGRMVEAVVDAGSEHRFMPVATKNPFKIWANARRLADLIRNENVDVIHARSRAPAWSCYLASRWTAVPMITTYHSGYREENALKRFYNSVMVRGDRVIAVSNWIADTIFSRYGPDPSSVVVIHRAVDPTIFDPAAVSENRKEKLREAWNIPPNTSVLLVPGRIAHRKGQHLVVQAVNAVKGNLPPFVCVFAGDDQGKTAYRKRVRNQIEELGIGDLFRFPGYVTDMPAAYAIANITVSAATAPEGFQRGMLEAQAMGCPVIVSDIGPGIEVVLAPPDYDLGEGTGVNYDGLRWEALAEAITQMLSLSENERRDIGQRGSRWVRSTYTRERLTQATLSVYADVLRPKPAKDLSNVQNSGARILQVVPRLDAGGAEQTTVDIASALQDAGANAIVATVGGRMLRQLDKDGGTWLPFPAASKNPWTIIRNAFRLAGIMKRDRVSLIHARSRAPAWSAFLAARLSKTPFVTTYHGAYNEGNSVKRFYNSVMARSDAVIANSDYTAELIKSRYNPENSRVHVIPRGIELSEFRREAVSEKRRSALRRHWRLAPHSKVILLPARLTEWKGQTEFIEMAEMLLVRQDRDLTFVMVGDLQGRHGYLTTLREQISAADLNEHVRVAGHCADMPAAFALSDCVVVPSTSPEAFGRTAVEAQAMGCPVVVSDIGAARETVLSPPDVAEDERTGWRCAPRDIEAFSDAIEAALGLSDTERVQLSYRARAHVADKYSTETMCRRTLELYDTILGTELRQRYLDRISEVVIAAE